MIKGYEKTADYSRTSSIEKEFSSLLDSLYSGDHLILTLIKISLKNLNQSSVKPEDIPVIILVIRSLNLTLRNHLHWMELTSKKLGYFYGVINKRGLNVCADSAQFSNINRRNYQFMIEIHSLKTSFQKKIKSFLLKQQANRLFYAEWKKEDEQFSGNLHELNHMINAKKQDINRFTFTSSKKEEDTPDNIGEVRIQMGNKRIHKTAKAADPSSPRIYCK